ncbi:hypothetical protein [Actinotalea sp. JY-7876]|uniref:hypothetical protein n=1 Tax=Actinotalea sp. JY-7876 TaxID=2758442 RepID=UPI0015F68609|nr:hypothetical protein [Actinotalea sp. JY-7876]
MTLIRHPETKAAFDCPEAVLEHWTGAAGWEVAGDVERPAPRTLLVLARTKAEATQYLKDAAHQGPALYVGDTGALRGCDPLLVDVAELASFPEHRHHDEITEALAAMGIRVGPTSTPAEPGGDGDDPGTDSSTTTEKE